MHVADSLFRNYLSETEPNDDAWSRDIIHGVNVCISEERKFSQG